MLKGGKRGPAVLPGNAPESLLYQVVLHRDELKMPLGEEPLSAEEVEILRSWIEQGARWVERAPGASQPSWWAFRRPERPAVSAVENPDWVRNPVDAFILRKLEQKGFSAAPPADKRTLIRRATFDLHGLPPTPAEVDHFVHDSSADAYRKLIERLLDSPRYGERWGRHWLDVVRYADTGGFETDLYFQNAWRYRDYVIESFNDDKPFHRFVQEQVAGDELWPDDLELAGSTEIPKEKLEHLQARIATGLYTIGPIFHESAFYGEKLRYERLVEAVDVTGAAFLGLSLSCARCHDHKFDPLSQRDYHRMMAIFAGSEIREVPVVSFFGIEPYQRFYPKLVKLEEYKAAIKRIEEKARDRAIEAIKAKFPREVVEAYELEEEKRTPQQQELAAQVRVALLEAGLKENAAGKKPTLPYTPEETQEKERLTYELGKAMLTAHLSYPTATILGHSDVIHPVHVTVRGDFRQKGEQVGPGFPTILSNGKDLEEPSEGPFVPQRRKALALWLTRPDHPLTARVMVNRIWQWHFGRGLVATPNNFGRQGEPPTHPELLDWLAVEFVERGWSIKAMHRLMMLSNTYQMGSRYDAGNAALDPQNRYLWRMNRRRLDAEALRDSVLTVAGTLNLKMGGKPVVLPLSEEEKVGMLDLYDQWPVSLDAQEHTRRSVYLYVKRSFLLPMFATFDMPDTSISCARRDVTTVAPQALALLNSEFMVHQAQAFANRLQKENGKDPRGWIQSAWRLALGRTPSREETEKALELFNPDPGGHTDGGPSNLPEAAEALSLTKLGLLMFNLNEFLYLD